MLNSFSMELSCHGPMILANVDILCLPMYIYLIIDRQEVIGLRKELGDPGEEGRRGEEWGDLGWGAGERGNGKELSYLLSVGACSVTSRPYSTTPTAAATATRVMRAI